MTQNTAERAEFEAWARDRYPSIDLTRECDDYAKALAKDYWSLWQAARRAPAAQVPQGWRQPVPYKRSDNGKWATFNIRAEHADDAESALKAPQPPEAQVRCWCLTCRPVRIDDPGSMRMALCPNCGNKRCPKANNHGNACTRSNEPGQPGSAYPVAHGITGETT